MNIRGLLTTGIQGITSDSREVAPGFIYVAVRGGSQDGHRFIADAITQGAVTVVGEADRKPDFGASYIQVTDSREALAELAAGFYGDPSLSMKLVGVTGTSGKTTTTYLIESILENAGYRVGVIGTVNFRFGSKIFPSTHTTPGAVELQRLLSQMKAEGCNAVVMEVSSHALKQKRVWGLAFETAVFTNLSREHLDFHPDMEDYFQSKRLLFTLHAKHGVINADDEYGRRLLDELKGAWSFAIGAPGRISGAALTSDLRGIRGTLPLDGKPLEVKVGLVGEFNVSNLLGAIGATRALGLSVSEIERGLKALKSVPGRLERVQNSHGLHVLVDYAHKPDALEKVLKTLQSARAGNRLITVFGCGGDRDRTKRPVMGKIAVEHSDEVIVTSDNPRTEDPMAIIQEIQAGIPRGACYQVEPDREKAIHSAIRMAKRGDVVLIAGKGHEDYQIIADPKAPGGTRKIHLDDREVALAALASYS